MNTLDLLLALASDARLTGVAVADVVDAINAVSSGRTTVVKGDKCLFVNESGWNVYDERAVYYTAPNGKQFVIGNPCGYDDKLNRIVVRTGSLIIAPANKALPYDIMTNAAVYPVR